MPCFYCDRQFRRIGTIDRDTGRRVTPTHPHKHTRDHVIPKARLSAKLHPLHDAEWRLLDIVPACFACNNRKGDMWPLDWLVIMPEAGVQRLHDRLLALGCPREEIIEALAYRGVYQALTIAA